MKLVTLFFAFVVASFGSGYVNAQTSSISENILTPSTSAWSGSVTGTNAGYSGGGSGPSYNATTNTITFGYTTATATQTIAAEAYALQHALDLSNSGIKIQGYNYSWKINNSGEQSGTLTGQVSLMRGTTALETYNYNYNATTNGFEVKTGTQNFANEYSLLASDSMRLSFTGKDSRFWAGYYGPQVREPSLTMNYTVDYCASNPLYSPSCSGYNAVLTSQDIAATTYAINTALNLSGSGVMIHGYRYGYTVALGDSWYGCTATNQDGSCSWWMSSYPIASVATSVRDSTNALIRPMDIQTYSGTNSTNNYNFSVVFDNSRSIGTMGNFSMGVGTSGNASVTNKWSNWQYTPDLCVANPLYSPTCDGYAAAYKAVQCSASALYDPTCPDYAAAFKTQQCNINGLYDTTCSGYAAAYLTYQCSINPLYSTTCAGYAEAYKTQQCALDGLYDRTCTNYADAYARKYVIGIPSSGTISYGPADSRCTVGCDTTSSQNTNAGPATSGYSGPGATNVSTTQPVTSISNTGQISTGVAITSDSNVNAAIATPRMDGPAASTGNSPVASSMNSPGPAASGSSTQTANAGPATRQEQKSEDRKDDAPKGTGGNNSPQNTNTAQASSDKPAAPTARQEIQARREAAAKAEAVEKGKNLANEMGKASDMEAQKAVQNVVIQAMGFTPGFDTYGKQMIVQQQFYPPYTVYSNQRNLDNRANQRMFGGTDRMHNDIVESQYNRGN